MVKPGPYADAGSSKPGKNEQLHSKLPVKSDESKKVAKRRRCETFLKSENESTYGMEGVLRFFILSD